MIDMLAVEASTIVTVDEQYVNIALGTVLPLLVGLVTRKITKTSVKRVLLIVLSILGGALAQIAQQGGTFDLKDTIVGAIVTYFTAQTAYSAVLKPSGISEKVADKTSGVGLVISADPAKEAALAGQASTAGAVAATVGTATVVTDVSDVAEVGDEVAVEEPYEDADGDGIEDVPDVEPEPVLDPEDTGLPYDEDPDDEVPVLDPADLSAVDPDEPTQ